MLHDSLATSPYVIPIQQGWVDAGTIEVTISPSVTAASVGTADAALAPSSEMAILAHSHRVASDVAIVQKESGPVAMRVPVRPDEIEHTSVVLYETSGIAEILARATLEPYYGIRPIAWRPTPDADARVTIVEGAEALREPEAGFSEDLYRAWFILTGEPVVSHVLAVPSAAGDEAASLVDLMHQLREAAHERRRELRSLVAERHELPAEIVLKSLSGITFALQQREQRALTMLLQRGNKGSSYPYPWEIGYLEAATGA